MMNTTGPEDNEEGGGSMRKAVRLIRDAMNATRTWPDHDLFEEHVEEEPRSRPRERRRNRIAPTEVERSASGNRS